MSRFSVEYFRLTVPKNCVEELFTAVFQKSSSSENVYGKEGRRRVPSFSVENFLSHSAERFRRRGGGIKVFRRKFFVSLPKISIGESFSVALNSAIEKVWRRGGGGVVGVSRFSV